MVATSYTKTPDGELVGHKMKRAVQFVDSVGPVASQNVIAKHVGPNGSQDYGYRIVKRCLKKGLLEINRDHPAGNPRGNGAVVVTRKGEDYLETIA